MAQFRLEADIIRRQARDKDGVVIPGQRVSVVAKAAYRSGQRLRDEQIEKPFQYRSRTQEVIHREIMVPQGAPEWLEKGQQKTAAQSRSLRERLWNEIERVEKRKDSQLAREFLCALPKELNTEQHLELIRGWCQQESLSKGYVVDFAIHRNKDGTNPHAHILCTTRPVGPNGFGKKPSMEGKFNGRGQVGKGAKSDLVSWRASWAAAENAALEKAGRPERVDHRSLKDQGIDRLPQPKIGVAATALKRKGIVADPERFRLVRWVKSLNEVMPQKRAIETKGEVAQMGVGKTWWERSIVFMSRVRQVARETVMDTWRMLLASRTAGHDNGPAPQKGPDISR